MTNDPSSGDAGSFPASGATELAALLGESRYYARELLGSAFPAVQASNIEQLTQTSIDLDAELVVAALVMLRDRDPLSRLYLLSALHELLESGGAHRGALA